MNDQSGWKNFNEIIQAKGKAKAPAYPWQDLALKIIDELNIPGFKRNAVFKVCRDYSKQQIEQALIDTKELCQSGLKWKYFFKVIANLNKQSDSPDGTKTT